MSIKNILKKFGLIFFTFIFCTLLTFLILGFGLLKLTQYETLQPIMTDVLSLTLTEGLNDLEKEETYNSFILECDQSSTGTIDVPLYMDEETGLTNKTDITLNCDDVRSNNIDGIAKIISKDLFDKIYYKDYGKENIFQIWNKLEDEEKSWLLFSNYFHEFLSKNIRYLFILTIIIGGIVVLLSDYILNGMRNIGMSCVFVGIPFLLIGVMKKLILSKVGDQAYMISSFVDRILSILMGYFKIIFIIGIVFVIISYIIKKFKKAKS